MTTNSTRAAEVAQILRDMRSPLATEAAEIIEASLRPTDTARARKPVAWMRRWKFDNNEGTKGNRPKGWTLLAVSDSKLLDDDVPLYLTATPPPPASGEIKGVITRLESLRDERNFPPHLLDCLDELTNHAETVLAALASTPQPAAAETVERAVAAERERCAMIADTLYPEVSGWSPFHKAAARTIAWTIRQSAKGGE